MKLILVALMSWLMGALAHFAPLYLAFGFGFVWYCQRKTAAAS